MSMSLTLFKLDYAEHACDSYLLLALNAAADFVLLMSPRMHVYVDTNIFLDFYQAATDRVEAFEEIVARAEHIVLPAQTVDEFKRNRLSCLENLVATLEKTPPPTIYTVAAIRSLPMFKEWESLRDHARKVTNALIKEVQKWIDDPTTDPVLQSFEQLTRKAMRVPTTDDLVRLAQRRKLLGQPPTTPNKHTIGDELIWESLLSFLRDDLVLVTRDKSFLLNESILRSEFSTATGCKLECVTRLLSKAFDLIKSPSSVIAKSEAAITAKRDHGADQEYGLNTGRCPRCNTELSETGLEGGDDSADVWWLYCPKCFYEVLP